MLIKPLIAANWKMNKNIEEAVSFINKFKILIKNIKNIEIVICAPFTSLYEIKKIIKNTNIKLGAQNMHFEEKGAFTGEISALMLKDFCEYVILGHSERRQYFNETDNLINKKIKAALKNKLKPILCIGETLEQRDNNETLKNSKGIFGELGNQRFPVNLEIPMEFPVSQKNQRFFLGSQKSKGFLRMPKNSKNFSSTMKIIENQLTSCLNDISENEMKNIVVAYEPVWAIGTGKNATPQQAEEVHKFIRDLLTNIYNENIAKNIKIIYGGSMKPENAKELLSMPNINGGLVGNASLEPESFAKICSSS